MNQDIGFVAIENFVHGEILKTVDGGHGPRRIASPTREITKQPAPARSVDRDLARRGCDRSAFAGSRLCTQAEEYERSTLHRGE